MAAEKAYTIRQLRGAWAAGRRASEQPKQPQGVRSSRTLDWTVKQCLLLAERYGPLVAFSAACPEVEWLYGMLVNLIHRCGWEALEPLSDRVLAGLCLTDDGSAIVEQQLEARMEETFERMVRVHNDLARERRGGKA